MELQSKEINELVKALLKVQKEIKPAIKSAENPHFKSKYADLASVVEVSRKLLTSNGLVVTQHPSVMEGNLYLITRLTHESGQWFSSLYPVNPTKPDPQAMGSALTYARRYSYSALVGIVTDDDDGNAASEKPDSPFKTATARKDFCKNVIASIMEAETNAAIDDIMKLNNAKIKAMMASGDEHDGLGVDEIRNQVQIKRNDFAEKEMNQQFKDATQ